MSTDTTPSPVSWFEIGTDDPAAARQFYGEMFGWTFDVDGPYSVITTGPDHTLQGGIQDTGGPLPPGTPPAYAVPCIQVSDVAAMCDRTVDLGGKVLVPATNTPPGSSTPTSPTRPATTSACSPLPPPPDRALHPMFRHRSVPGMPQVQHSDGAKHSDGVAFK